MVCRILLTVCSIVFLNVLSLSRGFSTGAPSSVCESMMPRHSGVLPQSSTAPYTIETGTSTYQPGIPKQVQILGPQYRGFILEARKDRSTTPLGSWQDPPENTKLLQCFGNLGAAVTHSSTAPKNSSTTFVWIPPESACPDAVTFTNCMLCCEDGLWNQHHHYTVFMFLDDYWMSKLVLRCSKSAYIRIECGCVIICS
ncbi:putative defense protein Hdd11 isoform X2 [Scyliorhinus canicula]|uniref:putative defense protein Hdd11 isoform X2 n=1 Tax=Scyliorhinus canicula TaxID=7830 RepID=UPI0018F43543|nr:putative defense protein Hdd11 isoform X2 [Scyliorhinus canicula]